MPYKLNSISYIEENQIENIIISLNEFNFFLIPVVQEDKDIIYKTKILDTLDNKHNIYKLFEKNHFKASYESIFILPTLETTLIFIGLGKLDKNQKYLELKISNAIQNALKTIKNTQIDSIGIELISFLEYFKSKNLNLNMKSLLTNIIISVSDFTYHSLEAKETQKEIHQLKILINETISDELKQFILSTIEARSSAKDLVNIPSNLKTTNTLVEKAKSLQTYGLEIEIKDDVKWIEEHMPCFFTVAKGSLATDPPKWIKVVYKPNTEIKQKIALIGKSVIFDTGGYQVKPDNYMNTMKADMTGGATVLSILEQVAKLKLPYLQITAYCAVTPNKIDSDAMLPDSIVSSTCGKKVEIRHTDAEGRLTLIDAIAMAERDKNDLYITIATLTGSAARAVGPRIALMATRKDIRTSFEESLDEICEPYQSLDVDEEDYEDIKSKLDGADINNTGSEKYRGAQTAAAFVFSGLSSLEIPCLHLDIAGGDMTKDEKATGITVKGILNYLYNLSKT